MIADMTDNSVDITFDNHGANEIEVSKADMKVRIDPAAEVGIYNAEVSVTD